MPTAPACGVLVAIVCWLPACKNTATGVICDGPPSTLTANPDGEVLRVTLTLFTTKFAVTLSAALIVTLVEALLGFATGPLQLENT